MISLSHKSKQYLLRTLKVLIVVGTFSYIYTKVKEVDYLIFEQIQRSFDLPYHLLLKSLFLFLFLSATNWFFEILKWKTAVSHMKEITFKQAGIQSLASLTVSLLTPNRIGEYGAKAMYFKKQSRKQILLLNFLTNSAQLFTTLVFGCIGILYSAKAIDLQFSGIHIAFLFVIILFCVLLAYTFKNKQWLVKGFTIQNVVSYFRKIPLNIKIKVVLYAIIRYLLFSYLFYSLLLFFGMDRTLMELMPLIFTMYLLASVIPSIFILDVVIKGGVALWLFAQAGLPQIPVLDTVFFMWILNFVIPSIIGSWFVITYKTPAV